MKLKLNKEQIKEINATRDILHMLSDTMDTTTKLLREKLKIEVDFSKSVDCAPIIEQRVDNHNAFNAIMEFAYDDSDESLAMSFDEYVNEYEYASDVIEIVNEPDTDVLQQALRTINTHGHLLPKPFTVDEFVEAALPNVVLNALDTQSREEEILPAFKDALIYICKNYTDAANHTLKYLPNLGLFEYTK